MESCSSLSEFSPLLNVFENPSAGGEVSEVMSVLRKDGENSSEVSDGTSQESRRNIHLANDKDEDGVFNSEKENKIESQEKRTERKRTTSGVGRRNIKFPCGVCSLGVGTSGIICGACCLWIHNGKTKKCAGPNEEDETHADTFRCPKCIETRE